MAGFIARLQAIQSVSARALEFLILTATRSGEVREAPWSEFELGAKVWTVPAGRMKAGWEHRVPLSPRAVQIVADILANRPEVDDGGYVFAGAKRGKPLSVMALDMQMRRLKSDDTVHGFRSTFRDWVGEEWLAAGFVDTEIRCSTGLESGNATTEVQPRVQA
ncbi:tyrosine-type recombinase/integrase [Ancylobacter radicis]|uniref:tyrosine-type recombinase/integrase n=1 Tax=Ancylobacter radicis TaxID=2836179 RepID=UPI00350EB874